MTEEKKKMFKEVLKDVLGVEGGYSDHPSDSGGRTYKGITEGLARKYGFDDVAKLKDSQIEYIYRCEFWDPMKLDEISQIMPAIVHELFDTAVNMGAGRAGQFLQKCLNIFNRRERDYGDLKVDGQVGAKTLAALKSYRAHRRGESGSTVMLRALNSLQGAFYIDLATRREKDEDFVYGWFKNRVEI